MKKILQILLLEPEKQAYWKEHVSTVQKGYVYLAGVWNVFTAMVLLWQALYSPALWAEVIFYAVTGAGILVMKSRLCALASVAVYGYSSFQYLMVQGVAHTWQLLMALLFVFAAWILLRFYANYYSHVQKLKEAQKAEGQEAAGE